MKSDGADRTRTSVLKRQREICERYRAQCAEVAADSMLGFATSTRGKVPINGLRHPAAADFSGWFLWCGEEFSYANDFFVPIHVRHVYEDYPQVAEFLGLPAGYRFLIAGEYVDVWYDPSLLNA